MNVFKTRIDKVFTALKKEQEKRGSMNVAANCRFLLERREGDYLIKVSHKNRHSYCGEGQKYINFTYRQDGWFSLGSRKQAQWFNGQEANELIKTIFKKGFTIVKK